VVVVQTPSYFGVMVPQLSGRLNQRPFGGGHLLVGWRPTRPSLSPVISTPTTRHVSHGVEGNEVKPKVHLVLAFSLALSRAST